MSLINEAYENEYEETGAPDLGAVSPENEETGYRFAMPDFSFLAAPTGEGAVEEYIEHPLNFDGKKSTARILRGCTGLCGSLNYALIDIALGIVEKIQEKNPAAATERKEWTEKEINNAY